MPRAEEKLSSLWRRYPCASEDAQPPPPVMARSIWGEMVGKRDTRKRWKMPLKVQLHLQLIPECPSCWAPQLLPTGSQRTLHHAAHTYIYVVQEIVRERGGGWHFPSFAIVLAGLQAFYSSFQFEFPFRGLSCAKWKTVRCEGFAWESHAENWTEIESKTSVVQWLTALGVA